MVGLVSFLTSRFPIVRMNGQKRIPEGKRLKHNTLKRHFVSALMEVDASNYVETNDSKVI